MPEIGTPGDWHSWRLAVLESGNPGDWKNIPFTRPSSFANRATKTPNRTYIHNAQIDEFESPEAMKHTNDMPNSIYACDRPQTTLTVFVVCGRSHAKRILNEKLGSKPFASYAALQVLWLRHSVLGRGPWILSCPGLP